MTKRLTSTFLAIPVIGFVAGLVVWLTGPEARTAVAQKTSRSAPVPDISGGTPGARRDIEEFIVSTASHDLQSALRSLRLRGDDYNMAFSGGTVESYLGPISAFLMVMADRRVARIYELLEQLPRDEAARVVYERFADDLADVQDRYSTWLATREGICPDVAVEFHALHAELFLYSQFGDFKTLLSTIDGWREVMGPLEHAALTSSHPADVQDGVTYGMPQRLFLVNIFLLHLQKHGCLKEDDIQAARNIGMQTPKNLVFSRWDAHTNQFDFTHKIRGVPVDLSNSIATFRCVYALRGRSLFDIEEQNRLVDFWRGIAEACNDNTSVKD